MKDLKNNFEYQQLHKKIIIPRPLILLSGVEGRNKYTLFDGLTYNTREYFASCVVFFRAPKGRGKIRAMSKMSARIIC